MVKNTSGLSLQNVYRLKTKANYTKIHTLITHFNKAIFIKQIIIWITLLCKPRKVSYLTWKNKKI